MHGGKYHHHARGTLWGDVMVVQYACYQIPASDWRTQILVWIYTRCGCVMLCEKLHLVGQDLHAVHGRWCGKGKRRFGD
ncbi:hypothetical protein IG631_02731 [Alternaria alternata]|nr:hypothetical protein IG631_02731 [Alternaria alternata]